VRDADRHAFACRDAYDPGAPGDFRADAGCRIAGAADGGQAPALLVGRQQHAVRETGPRRQQQQLVDEFREVGGVARERQARAQ
jgi:hypothetical protein